MSECKVSIIIPVKDDWRNLHSCLERLARQSLPSEQIEVILVDDDSEQPCPFVDPDFSFDVCVVQSDGRGSYAARNRGVEEARGAVLAFTDADCLPSEQWLESGLLAAERTRQPVGGKIQISYPPGDRWTMAESYEVAFAFRQDLYVAKSYYAATANLFVPREVFHAVGCFDERLRSGGDKEWGVRARKNGYPVAYCGAATVLHPPRRSLGELWRKHRRVTRGHIELWRLHGIPRKESNVRVVQFLARFFLFRLAFHLTSPLVRVVLLWLKRGQTDQVKFLSCLTGATVVGVAKTWQEFASWRDP